MTSSPTSNKSNNKSTSPRDSTTSPASSTSSRSRRSGASPSSTRSSPKSSSSPSTRSSPRKQQQRYSNDGRTTSVGSPSNNSNSGGEINNMKQQLYKTKVCRHYMRGSCRYGSRCTFAHQLSELGARPDFYKTKMCARRNCKDANCQYAHSPEELRSPFGNSSSQVCLGALDGSCTDPNCKLSHNKTQAQESILAGALELSRQGRLGQQQQEQQQAPAVGVTHTSNSSPSLDGQVSSSIPAMPNWATSPMPTVQSAPNLLTNAARVPVSQSPLLSTSSDLLTNMASNVSPTSSLLSMVSSPYSDTRSVQGTVLPPTLSLDQEATQQLGNTQATAGQEEQEPDLTDPNLLQALETLLAASQQQSTFSESRTAPTVPAGFSSSDASNASDDISALSGMGNLATATSSSEGASSFLPSSVYSAPQTNSLLGGSAAYPGTM
ncbi:hypothetical protein FOL47_003788 [Perkinsus chesapeaki]|uniref:C3H1-type domain-containing protein n=1 Tax=Perkinsus chesapeaki TaxID=330153 RepID=A0A7J6M687_PERCH|nr:hypothetical protein FOL47_003788 [Perkinsus chesapeaki]